MFGPRNIDCLLEVAIQPKTETPAAELQRLIDELSAHDPQFSALLVDASQTVLIRGRDELHLEQSASLFESRLGSKVLLGAPQIVYRETIQRRAGADQTQERGSYNAQRSAAVRLQIEPLEAGSGCEFENMANGDAVPSKLIPEIERSIARALDSGCLAGFPMTDIRVTLLDGVFHDLGSDKRALRNAIRLAFVEAANRADPVLLEPISLIEVTSPEDYIGDVLGDLINRRGWICGTYQRDKTLIIEAHVPVAEMFGYANTLANLTEGRATYSTKSNHYQRVPRRPSDDPPPSEPAAAALRA